MYHSTVATRGLLLTSAVAGAANAMTLDPTSPESIKSVAQSIARGILDMYTHGTVGVNDTQAYQVGLFNSPYYWWESGATWGGMLDYWKYTGDTEFENDTLNALNAQVGPHYDFIMPQQVLDEANDDQAFWTFNALSAHEEGLPLLPAPTPGYLTIAENVFNEMVQRWYNDSNYCGGGLRWQYTPTQAGYAYKNTVSNGGFFNIAARLALATQNQTYANWAHTIYEWTQQIGFLEEATGIVWDGANIPNCTSIDEQQWSYNAALYLHGAAVMYNYTSTVTHNTVSAQAWRNRTQTIMDNAGSYFFSPFTNSTGVMFEPICEKALSCDNDQWSFKAYLSRFMAKASQMAPFLRTQVTSLLTSSAKGAAAACQDVAAAGDATTCGTKWYVGQYEGPTGLGQQLSALECVQALLMI